MKKLLIFLSISFILIITGCATSSMEYRSATTAARSEKNLKRAEEWGLKALTVEPDNPQIPYFLAIEIYLPQNNFKRMAEMLEEALRRNPDQALENPFKLDDVPIKTIGQGVQTYRDQEWAKIYNRAVDLIQKNQLEPAEKQLEIAMLLHPAKSENYTSMSLIQIQNQNYEKASQFIEKGLIIDSENGMFYQMKADIFIKNNDLVSAQTYYEKALEFSTDPSPIMRKLIFIFIDLGENEKAIAYSSELLDKYPNDPDLYYNVGVLYQRLTLDMFNPTREKFLNLGESEDKEEILDVYNSFVQARKYAYNSRDYFLQASDLELDGELSTKEAISEMRRLMDQIDDIFIPSIRETARKSELELE